jgi:L-lactate dehydrogenase complex protein LldG
MTISREAFLERVHRAVEAGNRAGKTTSLGARGQVGYQGAGPDPVARFAEELRASGGQPHLVPDAAAAVTAVLGLVKARSPARVLVGRGAFLDALGLADALRALGIVPDSIQGLTPETSREAFFAADLAISGVHALIAETGTIVVHAEPDEPRSVSLLAPVHLVVAHRSQVLPDLFDLFEAPPGKENRSLPSCVSLITGPSKTGDIELRLVTGVHGPGELHVVVFDGNAAANGKSLGTV